MFGRVFLLTTLFLAVIFISTLDAKKCNNFQLEKSVKTGHGKSGDECSGCTGYICKVGDKNILGSACTEDVKEICQQNWDNSKLKSIAKEEKYQSEKGKYFVFSCQEDKCNSVNWVTETSSARYAKEIAASDLSFGDGSARRFKREENDCDKMTEEERKKAQAALDLTSPVLNVTICPEGVGGGGVKPPSGGAEQIGYGIGLMVATLGIFLY